MRMVMRRRMKMFLLSACTIKSKAILPRHSIVTCRGLTRYRGQQRGRLASSETALSIVMSDVDCKRPPKSYCDLYSATIGYTGVVEAEHTLRHPITPGMSEPMCASS